MGRQYPRDGDCGFQRFLLRGKACSFVKQVQFSEAERFPVKKVELDLQG